MGTLTLLLCSLPPLAVMGVAVLGGLRTGSSAVLSMLVLSALDLAASVTIPLMRDEEPVQSVRFVTPDQDGVAEAPRSPDPIRLTRRSEPLVLYR